MTDHPAQVRAIADWLDANAFQFRPEWAEHLRAAADRLDALEQALQGIEMIAATAIEFRAHDPWQELAIIRAAAFLPSPPAAPAPPETEEM